VTLIDKKSGRAVRVSPKAEAMAANKQSDFFKKYREKGVPASQVPSEAVDPLVERVMSAPEDRLLNVGEVFEYKWTDAPHSFDSFVCEVCGEMTAEIYGRVLGDKKVCIPCRQKALSHT